MSHEVLKSIFLGIIQGITEFLPISSSGHLTLVQHLLGIKQDNLQFDIVVHFATLLSVLTVMRKVLIQLFYPAVEDIKNLKFKGEGISLLYKIIVATIPVGLVGVFLKDEVTSLFNNITVVALAFCFTGTLLLSTKFMKIKESSRFDGTLKYGQALVVGIFQAIAIIPGVSRSGASIVGGIISKMDNLSSVYFSFIISIPAILGASVLEAREVVKVGIYDIDVAFLVAGFISAYLSGVLGLTLVVKVAKYKKLHYFAPYLIALGLVVLIFL